MTTIGRQITADELLAMPHDEPCELIAGEIVKMTPPSHGHSEVSARITILVGSHVLKKRLGTMHVEDGCLIARDPDTVRVPDVAFVREERALEPRDKTKCFEGAPDFVVEVVSPTDRAGEVNAKAQAWVDAGALLVWIVWPDTRTVTIHRPGQPARTLRAQDTITGEDVLPGFECQVAEFFGD